MNKSEIARKFNVSIPTVTNWITQGCPYRTKGSHGVEWELSAKAVGDWLRANGKADKKKNAEDYANARTEKMIAESEMARMNADRLAGTLVPIDDVSDVVAGEYAIVRAHIRGLCNSLPPLLINKSEEQIAKIIAVKIDNILDELSDPERILEDMAPGEPEEVLKATNKAATK